jgi:hypothetical protein
LGQRRRKRRGGFWASESLVWIYCTYLLSPPTLLFIIIVPFFSIKDGGHDSEFGERG